MSLLSKSEIQFLQGQKQVSKSYEYELKSIIKKKISNLLDKELPLLSQLFPNLDLTKNGKQTSPLKTTIPGSNPGRSISVLVSNIKYKNTWDKLLRSNHQNQMSLNSGRSSSTLSKSEIWKGFRRYLINKNIVIVA